MKIITLLICFFLISCADYDAGRHALKNNDVATAKEHFETLALNYEHTESQVELAALYYKNEPEKTHGEKAANLLKDALAHDDRAKTHYLMGVFYADGYGVTQNGVKAIQYYEQAYQKGYVKAGYEMARLFEKGEIVPQSYDRAALLYLELLNTYQYARAEKRLYYTLAEKAEVENDAVGAIENWERLYSLKEEKAPMILAGLYREISWNGEYDQKVIALYEEALLVNPKAAFELGRIYEGDQLPTIAANGARALNYYKKAEEGGYERVNYFMARLYDRGQIIPQDIILARNYYQKAVAFNNNQSAVRALKKLEEKES